MSDRSARPLIGITAGRYADRAGRVYTRLPESYALAVAAAGGSPILIPVIDDAQALEQIFSLLDGILFPGGGDVDPGRYGESMSGSYEPDVTLDTLELELARRSIDEELPTLGICRGSQLLNVALDGSLIQDLPSTGVQHPQSDATIRDHLAHTITVSADSRLAEIFGETEFGVNSFHHQAVKQLGRGLRAVAWSPDRVIEAYESTDHPWLLAVQFHPENLVPAHEPSRRLFEAFVAACAEPRPRRVEVLARG
jgi:putative glutamine amidotransferase